MARIEGVQAEIIKNMYERALENKGHAFFSSNTYNLNIIGVRASKNFTNLFDDAIVVIYKNSKGWWVVDTYEATTDPGRDSIAKPLSKSGCAILVPGQYKSTYKLDLHGGKYLALCQRGGKVKVYRDNNRNKKYELNKNSIEEGMFGINIHRAKRSGDTKYVNSFSAGCQVFKNAKDYYEFLDTCQVAADRFSNSFTYTLIDEGDLSA